MIPEIYAMAPRPEGGKGEPQGLGSMLIPILFIFAIFYFLIIRPQRQRETKHRQFVDSLKKGDEVITQSGIYGRVAGVADNVVTLEIADHVRIRVSRAAVSGLQTPPAGEKK